MAQTVVITLTSAGADTGPFSLYSDIDGFVTPFETGVSKAALQAGYLSTLVPDGATVVRVKSVNLFCTNYINLTLPTTTTTSTSTSTTTSTTTPPPAEPSLNVYIRDVGVSANPAPTVQYKVNSGAFSTYGGTVDSSCNFRFSITGLTAGDVITVKTTNGYAFNGAVGDNVCPIVAGGTQYLHTQGPGSDSISITIDRDIIV